MYRSIGINGDKELYSILKHKKYPYLNHSTSLCNNNIKSQSGFKNDLDFEFSINEHQYTIEKKNLMSIGIAAIGAISIYKAYKYFTEV